MTTAPALALSNPISAAFARDGYYVAAGLFRARIPALEIEFDRICAQLDARQEASATNARWPGAASDAVNGSGRVIQHTHNVQRYSAVWARLWYEETFLDIARALLGPDLVLHHTKLFRKPAEKGAAFPMHQDWPYFPTVRDQCVAAIVHVSDATDDMGCLRVYPGSHREGRLNDSSGISELGAVQQRYPLDGAMPVKCAAGDVVFFHAHTVHGSRLNTSARVRKTVLAQIYAGSDHVEATHAASHPDARLVLSGWNQHMDRELAAH